MTSKYNTIDAETENNRVKNASETFNTLRINSTFCYTYRLLYCKRQIQMTSNYSTMDVEKENNRVKKSRHI